VQVSITVSNIKMFDTALVWYGTHRKQVNISVGILMVWVFYLSFWSRDTYLDSDNPNIHTAPPPKRDNLWSENNLFQNILSKNISTLTAGEFSYFLSFKEQQYRKRQRKIEEYCQTKEPKFGKKILKNSLIYDNKDGIGYCQIAKVASSTWCNHFIRLANVTRKEHHKWRNALQIFAPTLWPAPTSNVMSEWKKVTSIVIVRHPMSRLASVYYQKFIELYQNKGWAALIGSIIKNYRKEGEEGPKDQPTPNEFLRFVLDDLKSKGADVDQHWRQQHLSCPFCLLEFSVYARMEELDQDSLYFFSTANLTTSIDYKEKLNSAHAASSTEKQFWSKVDKNLIERVGEAYYTDFQMFGYSVQDYLRMLDIIL